ncbi:NEUR3 protein, partial [Nothoprocta pentlandii]|nr:NEUR3 protein [Nothoprocta pentlandii]
RLAAPAYAYYVHRRLCGRPLPCCTRPHALVVYSDDQGRSWSKGALVQGVGTGECQVAEVATGDGGSVLYCSARPRRLRCRAVALSTDRGLRFGRSVRCEELCEPPRGCQGSVVSFTPEEEDDDASWLLFSHPTDRRRRRDLGVYVNPSPLSGSSWWPPWLLYEGPCGYSDLAVCPGGLFGCLFECGPVSGCEEIAFCLFSQQQLLSAC